MKKDGYWMSPERSVCGTLLERLIFSINDISDKRNNLEDIETIPGKCTYFLTFINHILRTRIRAFNSSEQSDILNIQ